MVKDYEYAEMNIYDATFILGLSMNFTDNPDEQPSYTYMYYKQYVIHGCGMLMIFEFRTYQKIRFCIYNSAPCLHHSQTKQA
jgi:hypothetical protein